MWQKKSSKEVHKNNWFSVTEDKVIRHNGTECNYYVVKSAGSAVFVIPVSKLGIYLIEQYRYGSKNISWEIPAGGLDNNENPLEGAKRELEEETGLLAEEFIKIGEIFLAPGLTDTKCYIYKALVSSKKADFVCQEDEAILDCACFSVAEIKEMIKSEKINDGPTLAVLARSGLLD